MKSLNKSNNITFTYFKSQIQHLSNAILQCRNLKFISFQWLMFMSRHNRGLVWHGSGHNQFPMFKCDWPYQCSNANIGHSSTTPNIYDLTNAQVPIYIWPCQCLTNINEGSWPCGFSQVLWPVLPNIPIGTPCPIQASRSVRHCPTPNLRS